MKGESRTRSSLLLNSRNNSKAGSNLGGEPDSMQAHRNLVRYSQQDHINKWDLKVEKYRKHALSKRRQQSSYKSNTAKFTKISEVLEEAPNAELNKQLEIECREPLSDREEYYRK